MVERYAAPARWLHWLTVVMVIALFGVGSWINWWNPADPALSHRLYNLHESTGVTLFAVVLARLLVRLCWPPPPPVALPIAMRLAASATHTALYALLLLQAALGFVGNAAGGTALVWYEILPIPTPVAPDKALSDTLSTLHLLVAGALALLIGVHVLAAVYHQFIRRDGTLQRML